MMTRIWVFVLLALCAATITPSHSAAAGWKDKIKVLRIGVVVADNPRLRLSQLEPFRRRIERDTGVPVELVPSRDFNTLVDSHTSDRIDYAIYSASAYAAAYAFCECLEPIAAPRAGDGSLGYHSLLIVRSDSGRRTLDQLKGATIALSAGGSTAGHLVPMSELRASGIDPQRFFKTIRHSRSVAESVKSVLDGFADVGVAWSTMEGDAKAGYARGTLHAMVLKKELAMSDVAIVWRSRRITHGPHAVSKRLPEKLKELLVQSLVKMKDFDGAAYDAVERFHGGGFAEVTQEDYAFLAEIFAAAETIDPTAGLKK